MPADVLRRMEGGHERNVRRHVVAYAGMETAALRIIAAHGTTSLMLTVSGAAFTKLVVPLPVLILSLAIHWSARIAVCGVDGG